MTGGIFYQTFSKLLFLLKNLHTNGTYNFMKKKMIEKFVLKTFLFNFVQKMKTFFHVIFVFLSFIFRERTEKSTKMPEVLSNEGPVTADDEDFSIFENKTGLAEDLKFLASMPELCDVTFLVGETREPVCAVKVT